MTSIRGILLDEAVNRVVPQGRRVGLVIGIDAYDDASGIPRLNAAVADAKAIHAVMVDPACGRFSPDDTKVLTDGAATGQNIRIALERLRKQVAEDDEVWFFFAGHGLLVDGQHRLLPVDAQRDVLDATSVDFPELFSKIRCRRKIVFLDCCHAGASDATTRNVYDVGEVFNSYPASGTVTYCSSDGDQKSVELPDEGHGAFTYWLEKGLRGAADFDGSGVVTSDELWQYVCNHVEEDARRLTGRTQTPRIKTDTSGPFPLSVNIGGVQARQAEQERKDAEVLARKERLEADRKALRGLLGEDQATHLSTDEMRATITALEEDESSRTSQIVRKALDAFRATGDVDVATAMVRGVLPPRPSITKEIERRKREALAEQSRAMSGSPTPPEQKLPTPPAESKKDAERSGSASREKKADPIETPKPPVRWGPRIAIAGGVLAVLGYIGSGSSGSDQTTGAAATVDSTAVAQPDADGWREDLRARKTAWQVSGDRSACAMTDLDDGAELSVNSKDGECILSDGNRQSGEARFVSTLQWSPGSGGGQPNAGVRFGEEIGGSPRCVLEIDGKEPYYWVSCNQQRPGQADTMLILSSGFSNAINTNTNKVRVELLRDSVVVRINEAELFKYEQPLPTAVVFRPFVTLTVEPTEHSKVQFRQTSVYTRPIAEASASDTIKR
jgi:hypothetical protein